MRDDEYRKLSKKLDRFQKSKLCYLKWGHWNISGGNKFNKCGWMNDARLFKEHKIAMGIIGG